VVNAAPILFTFEATITSASNTYSSAGGFISSGDSIGGLGVGDSFTGSFTLTDELLLDGSAANGVDTFSLDEPVSDQALMDVSADWQVGAEDYVIGPSHAQSPWRPRMGLRLTDAPDGDSVELSLSQSFLLSISSKTFLNLSFVDADGNAFAGPLDGNYFTAIDWLTTVDLGNLSQATGEMYFEYGGHSITRQRMGFSLTSLTGGRAVPEPAGGMLALLGLVGFFCRKRAEGANSLR